ncbi:MAG TPA: protein phosphatase 2C domain-containing protein [Bryobacteraceae bacterium]|nr:protein phosphatase 2C domain-containing protein [Bryobacteraceae bacterium]
MQAAPWRSAAASEAGAVRAENQDRVFVDHERGIFLVVDGLGGHAAGEMAAETAANVIRQELAELEGDVPQRVRGAIAAANDCICELAADNEAWRGMACVLTLAVIRDGKVTVGHVGDSRLYLIWNGALRKLTSDHSPVGEREDQGELTEAEAMAHPRRHEVFRDVGSRRREPDEEDFIELKEFLFKNDAALLLCSDGLTDLVPSAEIRECVERYDGDPAVVVESLVNAANRAGGKDNISVVFVAGSEFLGSGSAEMAEARARHAITRMRAGTRLRAARAGRASGVLSRAAKVLSSRVAFLVYGFLIGVVLALTLHWPKP